MTAKKKKTKRTYEEAFADLGEIVESLESGKLTLEESLQKYEKGVKALQECFGTLSAAEKKITKLVREGKNKLVEIPFEPDTEEDS